MGTGSGSGAVRHSGDISAQIERRCKRRGWNARQAEAVMTESVFETEFDVLERERCGGALLVAPDDRRVVHNDTTLPQQPSGKVLIIVGIGRIEGQTGDVQFARNIATNRHLRLL